MGDYLVKWRKAFWSSGRSMHITANPPSGVSAAGRDTRWCKGRPVKVEGKINATKYNEYFYHNFRVI